MEIRYKNLYQNKTKAINFNLRIRNLNEIKINPKIIYDTILLKTAQWAINELRVKQTKLLKTKKHPITFLEKFLNIQNNSPDHHYIYTDGPKQGMKVGCAAILWNQELLKCHLNESLIYNKEVTTIDLAMNIIANHKSSKFIFYSDSKSVLLAL